MTDPRDDHEPTGGRRSFVKKVAAGAAATWIAPAVLTAQASAQGSSPPAGTGTSLGIGGPPTTVGSCGQAIVLPGAEGEFTLYSTAGVFTVTALTANGGGAIDSIAPSLPYLLLNSPPLTITTTGTITGFTVTVDC